MKIFKYLFLIIPVALFTSCSDDKESNVKNDFLKKTTSPAIVGETIEFAYAMGTTSGRLNTAEAVASIPGAQGTGFGLYSYYTVRTGPTEASIQTVKETSTNGATSTAAMEEKVDTHYMNPVVPLGTSRSDLIAATLRYYYVVPEEARGKEFSLRFAAKSTDGGSASYQTPAYKVSKMDMKRLIVMTNSNACYFSVADMEAYTKEEVENRNLSEKIDFVYMYQAQLGGFTYNHAFVSPGTDPMFVAIPANIPPGWTKNNTLMEKRVDVRDAQLKGSIPNVYIDDIDFETLNLSAAVDYVLDCKAEEGAFMKTADGKYAAYIFINSLNTDNGGTMTVSIKRYPLK
ncbi:MAG: DUF4466 family protein [Prevotella sp.]|jgi:hypothetical protein|nr:DUF4466 family protein [Prevotella sp.]